MSIQAVPADRLLVDRLKAWRCLAVLRTLCQCAVNWLPEGGSLPEQIWQSRHRGIVVLLWLHVAGLMAFAMIRGVEVGHSVLEALVVAGFAIAGGARSRSRRLRAAFATLGLVTSSALLVHFSGGLIEMHFHFFVMLGVITLYQDWVTYLLAVVYVALHHGTVGVIDPTAVYNHPAAWAKPWHWALIHAAFVLAANVSHMVAWRLTETYRIQAERGHQQEGLAEFSRRALSSLRFEELAQEAVDLAARSLHLGHAAILEMRPDGNTCVMRAGVGFTPGQPGVVNLDAGPHTLAGSILQADGPVVINQREGEPAVPGLWPRDDGAGTVAGMAIPSPDGSYGVLAVMSSHRREFRKEELGFLQAIANTLGSVLRQRRTEERLTYQALHDSLTGIANRALFLDRVEHALGRKDRSKDQLAVLLLDLDNFKTINDSFGHAAGDTLLVAVTQRLKDCLRSGDTIARLGGDEFAILLEDADAHSVATRVAQRVAEALRAPVLVGDTQVVTQVSIGIATASADTADADQLMRNADLAMYVAKARGRGRVEIYEAGMYDTIRERLALEDELRQAITNSHFVVHYQPTIDLRTNSIVGVEALVRWEHPARGLIPPASFIPLAEETGLIVPLGHWVLVEACRQVSAWQDEHHPYQDLKLSVNLSPRQFEHPDLVDNVAHALRDSGLDPTSLILEITEGVMMQNIDATITKLNQLKALGMQVAIDDFGTGYSSLNYLRQFPVDILKIDRSFIAGLNEQAENSALTRTIIELGRSLLVETIAEGIERPQELQILQELGCHFGQGYYFSRPLPTSDIAHLLSANTPRQVQKAG